MDAETLKTGPIKASSAAGFYANLLENKRWWAAELKAEGMMDLSLPSPATTNGTWLKTQAVHGIVKNMITRQRTWQPRYGVCPGYGAVVYHGVPDVFTSTATAALEFGAMPYAKGVIDYQFKHYIRTDGMVWHRATELPATARMLTILALYYTYSNDDALLIEHFAKAQGVAEWLAGRRSATLHYGKDDPRYGIPGGNDGVVNTEELMNHVAEPLHWYASAAELYRACSEMGVVWAKVGAKNGRKDIAAHGAVLLDLAGELYHDLHVSMNRTVKVSSAGERCWQAAAEPSVNGQDDTFRGYAEMLYSGALTAQQAADIYLAASGRSSCSTSRYLVAGSPGLRNTPTIATPASYGFAQGLLQNDEIEKFLLHFFAISAHGYTRGTWTTPESSNIADRDIAPVAYSSAGVVVVPTYLKWMLCFEDPETRTLWLGKAVPRDWLAAGEAPLNAQNVTTRYGRISFALTVAMAADTSPSFSPSSTSSSASVSSTSAAAYVVHANITLPASYADKATQPAGGIRLRIRAPMAHAGKLSKVTIGGQPWTAFNAAEETVDISAEKLTAALIAKGLPTIVATFEATLL